MLQLDKKFLEELQSTWVKKIKVFLYEAGCSGKKVDILIDDFELNTTLIFLQTIPLSQFFSLGGEDEAANMTVAPFSSKGERSQDWGGNIEWIQVYVPKIDAQYLENARITRTIKADHTGKEKIRYILSSSKVKERCGCGSSFSFEKKVPRIDTAKLKNLKFSFKK